MSKPIAIRSLQCEDHAHNIPPKVLALSWFVGKRCNYDCSYCSPHNHDAVSPFLSIPDAKNFVNQVHMYCSANEKQIKWSFTGGEPFLNPSFVDLLHDIRDRHTTDQINVITNGSLPIEMYLAAAKIVDGITISVHPERSEEEIAAVVEKCTMIKDCFVSVNLMCASGRLEQIKMIQSALEENKISYVLRKITPMVYQEHLLPFVIEDAGRKSQNLRSLTRQSKNKMQWLKNANPLRDEKIAEYYSQNELDHIAASNNKKTWQNCGVWFDDGVYKEINSDYLVANDLSSFRGWICYAGVDSLYVDFDGQIYRGMCQNAGAIGHISQDFQFSNTSTICELDWCTCNNDICVRKARSDQVRLVLGP